MSDSDNDLLSNNVFSFQNENTTVWARGPNINTSNVTGLSFRNNVLTSTMQMPRNFERERFTEGGFGHRSAYYRRETSPMSMYSGSDMRARNHSYYSRGMSSQRSVFNGRSGSPMSVRTVDSNASVSATDIAMAFKNMNFNKYDLRIIKDAYNKFMKHQVRKKVEKRRNLRLFMKGMRRKSGYDSGEQGSDSSISSNDCRSNKGSVYKENMSSGRSTRTDLTEFKRTTIESNMYKDCSENFKKSTFKNMLSIGPRSFDNIRQEKPSKSAVQGERFKNGFLLPSQRFHRSNASAFDPIQETHERVHLDRSNCKRSKVPAGNIEDESDSEPEEIFSERTIRENSTQNKPREVQQKRCLENEEENIPNRKRTKISSPIKKTKETKMPSPIQSKRPISNDSMKDFEFIKPTFPVRKSANLKTQQERLLAKSSQPKDIAESIPNICASPKQIQENHKSPNHLTVVNNEEKQVDNVEESQTQTLSTSDIAMRPSFIKRKLFTQKLDVTEKRNASSDSLNSPAGNVYNAIQKEKHRARKLVTSQSCLSRDIQEDNNLIDLIHKIVPPERISLTQTIRSDVSKQNKSEDDDRWDVTSVITTINDDNVSDTYTDEEIFKDDKTKNDKTEKPKSLDSIKTAKDCRIVLEKLPDLKQVTHALNKIDKHTEQDMVKNKNNDYSNNSHQKSFQSSIKSFWDTDLESDIECSTAPRNNNYLRDNQTAGNLRIQEETRKHSKPKPELKHSLHTKESNKTLNNNMDTSQKINISYLKIRSHRTPKKRKWCNDQSCMDTTKSIITQSKNFKINQPKSSATKENLCNVTMNQTNTNPLLDVTNTSRPIRSCRKSKNSTINTSKNISMNTSDINKSLRSNTSRKAKLSPVKNINKNPKSKPKITDKIPVVKSRESDVSFSLATETVRNKNVLNGSQIVTRGQSKEIKMNLDASLTLSSNKKALFEKDNKTMNKQNLNNSKIIPKHSAVAKIKKIDQSCPPLRSSKRLTPQKKAVANKKSKTNKN